MTEEQVLNWIHSTELFGSVLGLDTIRELLKRLGNPQNQMKIVHVAGTNGKGSVCSMLASILTESGYKTGLYTSPYIEQFRERIRIDGQMISADQLAKCGKQVKQACEQMTKDGLPHPTEFELVTALGFLYYAQQQCDFVVLEVGLGGRLDATNVIDAPLLSIITSIDFDHVARLGNTLKEIAFEKCGIIKKGTVVVTSPNQPDEVLQVIKARSNEESVSLCIAKTPCNIHATMKETVFVCDGSTYSLPLLGQYQTQNGATVLEAVKQLNLLGIEISDSALRRGLAKVEHIARLELIRPNLLIDGGHNLSGIKALTSFIRQTKKEGRIYVVAGMLKDKDYVKCAKLLRGLADVLIATETDSPRKLEAKEFSECCQADLCEPDLVKAVKTALDQATDKDMVIACGSFTLVGPVRSNFLIK